MVITIICVIFKCSFILTTGTGDHRTDTIMISTLSTHILIETLKTESVSFEFSLDFDGQISISSYTKPEFLDNELILRHFIQVVPLNGKTEGTFLCKDGVVQIWYDIWDDNEWDGRKYREVL